MNNIIQLLKRTQEIHFTIQLSVSQALGLSMEKSGIGTRKKGKHIFKNFPKNTSKNFTFQN